MYTLNWLILKLRLTLTVYLFMIKLSQIVVFSQVPLTHELDEQFFTQLVTVEGIFYDGVFKLAVF